MNKPIDQPVLLPGIVTLVPIDLIDRDEAQPRTEFEEEPLARLADDIKAFGIKRPVELRVAGDRFILEDGERRWRAAQRVGLEAMPALLAHTHAPDSPDLEARERLLHQAAETTLREPLSVMDKARLLRRLRDEFGIKVGELPEIIKARGIGDWSRPYISNLIRILDLPDWVTNEIAAERIPASSAKFIAEIADLERAMETLRTEYFAELVLDIEENGRVTESDVKEWVVQAVHSHYPAARAGWNKNAAFYDVDEHAKTIGLRKIGDAEFITDLLAHEALQAQHPKPHPKSPAATHPHVHGKPDLSAGIKRLADDGEGQSGDKEEKKPRDKLLDVVNVQRIQNYLIDWWRDYISMHLRTPQVVNAVVSWCASGAPKDKSAYFGYSVNDIGVAKGLQKACEEFKRNRLGDFLAHDLDDDDRMTLFDRALEAMDGTPIMDIVQWAGVKFDEVYVIDSDFLAMHTKATLDKLVRDTVAKGKSGTEARQSWNDCVKLEAMRGWCLARATEIGVPKELAKVWRDLQAGAK